MIEDQKRLQETRQYWDGAAAQFDAEPDHGLSDPLVREAWTGRLRNWLPAGRAEVLDIGCGTGSLSVVLAGLGHAVTGIDLSPAMIGLARAKASAKGLSVHFQVMDAAFPGLAPRRFDAILCRHLLWALPEPELVLRRWLGLLKQAGRLILIEGFWHTGAGLHAGDVLNLLPPWLSPVLVENLSDHPELWGGPVTDERYAVLTSHPG
jgi:2-polyprenyl-3-methyl-5-hydroxy-6-metoxy-1,4-benzoquinol methylase